MDFSLFFNNFTVAAIQVVILYLIVAAGFFMDKKGLYTQKTAKASNDLLFMLITPCVIIEAFMTTEFTSENTKNLLIAVLGGVITHLVGIVLTIPLFRKKEISNNAVYKYACIYGNMGYMALPLAKAVLGEEGVFYTSAGIIVFQVFAFTHGIRTMQKGNAESSKFTVKTLLFNPGVIGVLIGLPFFLLKVNEPDIILRPISLIASMNTPLAMLMLGTYMANADFRTIFRCKEQYLVALVKIILVPTVVFAIMKLTGLMTGALLCACIIQASAPSASNTVMFAAKYGKDTGTASKVVAFVSFVSILTMPVMIALAQM